MPGIDDVLAVRRVQPRYDDELWTFIDRVQGRNLENLSVVELQQRVEALDRSIQLLDPGSTPRDDLPPERGWLSPWWWLRLRHWTVLEFGRRGLAPAPTLVVPPMPKLRPEFVGTVGGGGRLLVRLGSLSWLMPMLKEGRLRFARASFYSRPTLDEARRDNELSKSILRPGQALQITTVSGRVIPALGDVEFSQVRARENGDRLDLIEYWLCSFSSDLDPRLFDEFGSGTPADDGCIVIFDPYAFVQQALRPLNVAAPAAIKRLFPVDYYDLRYPPAEPVSPVASKTLQYAAQREMRFTLDPEGGAELSTGDDLFIEVGSLETIAGVYSRTGEKLAGAGSDIFFA